MRISLAGDVRAPSGARDFVRIQLAESRLPSGVLPEDVVLIASELVTNAVEAGATAVEVDLRVSPKRVEIIVNDDAGGWPTVKDPDDHEPSGRGLSIVARLADRWTVTPMPPGKRIAATWFGPTVPHEGEIRRP